MNKLNFVTMGEMAEYMSQEQGTANFVRGREKRRRRRRKMAIAGGIGAAAALGTAGYLARNTKAGIAVRNRASQAYNQGKTMVGNAYGSTKNSMSGLYGDATYQAKNIRDRLRKPGAPGKRKRVGRGNKKR